MFVRPNWRELDGYKWLLGKGLSHFIAWEFLRRNPDYQEDLQKYRRDVAEWCCGGDHGGINSKLKEFESFGNFLDAVEDLEIGFPSKAMEWREHFHSSWKLGGAVHCEDDGGSEVFVIGSFDLSRELFKPISLMFTEITQARVMIPVDLSDPLEVINERVMGTIRRLRDIGIKSGVIVPRKTRVLSSRLYVEYLRILDGIAAGSNEKEIGEVLQPGATNEPDSRQRNKRIKAAYDAAIKMQDGGYRALLTEN